MTIGKIIIYLCDFENGHRNVVFYLVPDIVTQHCHIADSLSAIDSDCDNISFSIHSKR